MTVEFEHKLLYFENAEREIQELRKTAWEIYECEFETEIWNHIVFADTYVDYVIVDDTWLMTSWVIIRKWSMRVNIDEIIDKMTERFLKGDTLMEFIVKDLARIAGKLQRCKCESELCQRIARIAGHARALAELMLRDDRKA